MALRFTAWAVVAVGLAASAASCTTLRPVPRPDPAAIPAAIGVGDRVRIVDGTGKSIDVTVIAVGADFIEGAIDKDQTVRIGAAEIRELRERAYAPANTATLESAIAAFATGRAIVRA